jgi:glycine oxidase
MSSEVLIVGGGVIGLSIARELHKKGVRRITVVDSGEVGREASYAAAGMLAPNAETDKIDDFYNFCSRSSGTYRAFANELREETGIDIELDRSGTLYLAFTDHDVREIRERYRWQSGAGLNVAHVSARETLEIEPSVSANVRESLFFPNDWQVENRKLLSALRKYAELNGIEILEHVKADSLVDSGDAILGIESASGTIVADITVLATGAWTSLIKIGGGAMPLNIKPIRGQMICYQMPGRAFSKIIYSPRGYIVPRADGRILAGATVEDVGFNNNVTGEGIESLKEAAVEIAPVLANMEISESWAGLRPFAVDGLPVMGEVPGYQNLLVATAHYRNGILLAPLTANVIADKIANGLDSEYFRHFGPQRFSNAADAVGG